MLFNLDGTFWAQLINFAIFFAILNVVFIRPVGEAIAKRREYIDGVRSDYERYAAQVTTLRDDAASRRSAARRKAEETLAKARGEAQAQAAVLLEAATTEATRIADDARAQVEGELQAARTSEPALAQTLAQDMLARALGKAR